MRAKEGIFRLVAQQHLQLFQLQLQISFFPTKINFTTETNQMPSGAFSTGSHGGGGHSGHHDHHNHHHDHFDHHHNHHNGGWLGGIPFFGRRDYYQPDIYLGPYGGIQVDAGYLPPSAVYKSKPISS